MSKGLADIIAEQFPNAFHADSDTLECFCIVQDNSDGKGPFIKKWDATKIGAPKPDAAALTAAYQAAHPDE